MSLDRLDDAVFRHMNDVNSPVADVLAGIDAQIPPMARYFRGTDVGLRFIEDMDVGATNS